MDSETTQDKLERVMAKAGYLGKRGEVALKIFIMGKMISKTTNLASRAIIAKDRPTLVETIDKIDAQMVLFQEMKTSITNMDFDANHDCDECGREMERHEAEPEDFGGASHILICSHCCPHRVYNPVSRAYFSLKTVAGE